MSNYYIEGVIKNVTVDFSSNSSLTGESTVVLDDSPAEPEDSSKFAHKVFVYSRCRVARLAC